MTLDEQAARDARAWIDAARERLRRIKSLMEEDPTYRSGQGRERAQEVLDDALDFRDQVLRFPRPEWHHDFAAEYQKLADEARELID